MVKTYHFIIGTKAQLVKMAPVIRAFMEQDVPFKLVFTGQHQETMDELLASFRLPTPDIIIYDVGERDSTFKLLHWLIYSTRSILKTKQLFKSSAGFIVHGDTLSTLMGAIWAKLLKVKVIHIEAGLRSFNLLKPFPEEIVRILVSKLTNVSFAPNTWSFNNLKRIKSEKHNTQYNTIIDSLRYALNTKEDTANTSPYLVVSMHRVENIMSNEKFEFLMNQLVQNAYKVNLKFVLHPVTKKKLLSTGWNKKLEDAGVECINRMSYVNFVNLLVNSKGLLTDGGSNQEEAALMGLPCIILRAETERTEGLDSGITIAHYSEQAITAFVETVSAQTWQLKQLPTHSPSQQIAETLRRAT